MGTNQTKNGGKGKEKEYAVKTILIEPLKRKGEEVKKGMFKSKEKMLAKVIKLGCYKLREKGNEANRKWREEDDASTIMEDAWERENEEATSNIYIYKGSTTHHTLVEEDYFEDDF